MDFVDSYDSFCPEYSRRSGGKIRNDWKKAVRNEKRKEKNIRREDSSLLGVIRRKGMGYYETLANGAGNLCPSSLIKKFLLVVR